MPAKQQKRKRSSSELSPDDDEDDYSAGSSDEAAPPAGKTIEQRYQKKTQLEHILHRPESYIGSAEAESQQVWVWNKLTNRMEFKTITYVPGLYKIFDEILVNAADVKARELHEGVKTSKADTMTCIKVTIDPHSGKISVYNDGAGIPVEIHKEHKVYVPDLIFGHLLTSDNYDDSETRVTGGRNGYGAKLANIFSSEFQVECGDAKRKRKFRKRWFDNMTKSDSCSVQNDFNEAKSFVKVTFTPDLQRFKVREMDEDFVALLTKRVYDIAGACGGVKVWLNGRRVTECNDFRSYVDLYFAPPPVESAENSPPQIKGEDDSSPQAKVPVQDATKAVRIHEKTDRWEVVICQSDGQFHQVSFVNNICTTKGGTHVNAVAEPLVQAILKKVNAKNKGGLEIKAHQVKAHLWLFINCLIVNPTFDSQAKETMTRKASLFGSAFTPSEKTITAVIKSSIVESVLLWVQTKQQVELQKKLKGKRMMSGGRDRILDIPKLDDANLAGTKQGKLCTLILTEGESAKTSCVAGLSIVGKDKYGVYPLRGKILNVREASIKQQMENAEIQSILRIMGLEINKKFLSPQGLRYGHLMIMTDQDLDGSHIKGLLINMISVYWPDLLKYEGFLKEFVTPIVKVEKGKKKLQFFTLKEYTNWKETTNNGKGWRIKYYKGLGTSTNKEFMEYFSKLELHSLDFRFQDDNDLDAIDMAFNGKRAEDRKTWIQNSETGEGIDHNQKSISYADFVHKELVLFSRYDVERSIPNCIDGLKPVQRKILFACFKRNLKNEVKVAQLVGYVSEKTSYHHGEVSLGSTIITMAQHFVGSNNLNILQPCGQFGSRKEGGKDASAMRYIYTKLAAVTRVLFPEADDALLEYQNDDGLMVEPKHYVPIIPLVLVNGAEGIGTGWSSSVPNYNPREIIANIRRFIKGDPMEPMSPWYRGFIGAIEPRTANSFDTVGIIEKIDHETVIITELPIRVWTQPYKAWLEELVQAGLHEENGSAPAGAGATARGGGRGSRGRGGSAAAAAAATARPGSGGNRENFSILEFVDHSTHEEIHFTVKMNATQMAKAERDGLEKTFRLRRPVSTSNMTLFDPAGKVQRYASELDIMREFGQLRLQYYELRKKYKLEALERECRILKNKASFIRLICTRELTLANRKQTDILEDLMAKGLERLSVISAAFPLLQQLEKQRTLLEEASPEEQTEEQHEVATPATTSKDFDYLLKMNFWALSMEKVTDLEEELRLKREEALEYRRKTPEDLWEADLDLLETELVRIDEEDQLERGNKKKMKNVRRASLGRSLKSESSSDSDDDFAPKQTKRQPKAKAKSKAKPRQTAKAAPPPSDTSVWDALADSTKKFEKSEKSEKSETQQQQLLPPKVEERRPDSQQQQPPASAASNVPPKSFSLADRIKAKATQTSLAGLLLQKKRPSPEEDSADSAPKKRRAEKGKPEKPEKPTNAAEKAAPAPAAPKRPAKKTKAKDSSEASFIDSDESSFAEAEEDFIESDDDDDVVESSSD